jgi:hypothetical protein
MSNYKDYLQDEEYEAYIIINTEPFYEDEIYCDEDAYCTNKIKNAVKLTSLEDAAKWIDSCDEPDRFTIKKIRVRYEIIE